MKRGRNGRKANRVEIRQNGRCLREMGTSAKADSLEKYKLFVNSKKICFEDLIFWRQVTTISLALRKKEC